MNPKKLIVAAAAVCLGMVCSVQAGTIVHQTFDADLSDGQVLPNNEYAGITVANAKFVTYGPTTPFVAFHVNGSTANSNNTGDYLKTPSSFFTGDFITKRSNTNPLVITFAKAVNDVSIYIADVDGSESYTFDALDAQHNLIIEDVVNKSTPGNGNGLATLVSLAGKHVKYLDINPTAGAHFGLDYLTYTIPTSAPPPVTTPLPSSAAMGGLLAALVGLGMAFKRRSSAV